MKGWPTLVVTSMESAIVLPPVVIPALPLFADRQWPWFVLVPSEIVVLSVLCLATILLLPSAFLRVAATGRYAAAFQVRAAARFMLRNVRS